MMNFLSNIFFYFFPFLLCSVACFHMFASLIRFPASLYFLFFYFLMLIIPFLLLTSSLFIPFSFHFHPEATHSHSPTSTTFLISFLCSKKGNLSVLYHNECVFSFRLYHVQHSFI